jgi:exodeoxyribonuclease VII large subunit
MCTNIAKAFITAPNSDGQRDFKEVLLKNSYGFAFAVTEYLTQIQGDQAAAMITGRLEEIALNAADFDVVVIARGGGSDTDFKAFNDFDLARRIATFPVPILTGIGHDRNTSIADLMARQYKTPTEVAKNIVEHQFAVDAYLETLRDRLETAVQRRLDDANRRLELLRVRMDAASPEAILGRGYALLRIGGKFISDPASLTTGDELEIWFHKARIWSTISKIDTHE